MTTTTTINLARLFNDSPGPSSWLKQQPRYTMIRCIRNEGDIEFTSVYFMPNGAVFDVTALTPANIQISYQVFHSSYDLCFFFFHYMIPQDYKPSFLLYYTCGLL